MKLFLFFLLAFIQASTHAEQSKSFSQTQSIQITASKAGPLTSSHKIEPSTQKAGPTKSSHNAGPATSSHKVGPATSSHKIKPSTHKITPTTSSHKVGPTSSSHKVVPTTSLTTSSSIIHTSSVMPSNSTSLKPMTTTMVPKNKTSTVVHTSSVMPSNATSVMPMTTTMVPTLPPKTTPSPDQTFTLKDKDNNTCFQLRGDIKIMITYSDVNKTIVKKTFHMGHNTTTTGKCSDLAGANSSSNIMLSLGSDITLGIKFNGGDKWYMSQITAVINNKHKKVLNTLITRLVALNKYDTKSNGGFYQAQANHSYGCVTEKKLALHNSNVNTTKLYNITIDFKDIVMQPFLSKEDHSPFINGVTCPATSGGDTGSSIVPIAVGCALAGLIVIVLIAYLIGRRKGNNRGYQQV